MRKYGIEHFHIELLEETDNPEEREIYWIENKRSFKNGYNATLGGDGRKYIDYDLVLSTYKEVLNANKTALQLGISEDSVRAILKNSDIKMLSSAEVNLARGKIINQYDLNKNFIQSFPSAIQAAENVRGKGCSRGVVSHITDVCKGKRKTAYGYIWQYAK